MPPTAPAHVESNWLLYFRRFQRKTRDDAAAADLCQELWLKLSAREARHGRSDHERRLVDVAAQSVLRDWWRKQRRRAPECLSPDGEQPEAPTESLDETVATENVWAAVREELHRAVGSEKLQRLVSLWDRDGATLAEELGTSPAVIRNYRWRLIKSLRRNSRLRELSQEAFAA